MKINNYKLVLDEDRKASLVKESSSDLSCDALTSPQKVRNFLCELYNAENMAEEYVWLLALDSKCHLIGVFEVSHGTVDASLLYPREIFVRLCLCGAACFILAHNHPSGIPAPSAEDRKNTAAIQEASQLMKIPMFDHIIIGKGNYYSFSESGDL